MFVVLLFFVNSFLFFMSLCCFCVCLCMSLFCKFFEDVKVFMLVEELEVDLLFLVVNVVLMDVGFFVFCVDFVCLGMMSGDLFLIWGIWFFLVVLIKEKFIFFYFSLFCSFYLYIFVGVKIVFLFFVMLEMLCVVVISFFVFFYLSWFL